MYLLYFKNVCLQVRQLFEVQYKRMSHLKNKMATRCAPNGHDKHRAHKI